MDGLEDGWIDWRTDRQVDWRTDLEVTQQVLYSGSYSWLQYQPYYPFIRCARDQPTDIHAQIIYAHSHIHNLDRTIQDQTKLMDTQSDRHADQQPLACFSLFSKVQEERRVHNPSAGIGREHWDAFDPTLISEGLFAAANIFSSLKLIYIFTVNPHLGPLQISLGRMVIDIMKFLFIALLVCFSYSCGVNQLYWYYAEARNRDCAECQERRKIEAGGDCNCDTTLSKSVLFFGISVLLVWLSNSSVLFA